MAPLSRRFEVDSLGGVVWFAGERIITQRSLNAPSENLLQLSVPEPILGVALDRFSGRLWIAQSEALIAYSRTGVLTHTINLKARGLSEPKALAFDPVSRTLWVATSSATARLDEAGQLLARFETAPTGGDDDEDDEDDDRRVAARLAVPAFSIEPALTLERPPPNALTNNPRPEFILRYGARCNAEPCAPPADFLAKYRLEATVNDAQVGPSFVFDAATSEASLTPAERLPEGPNRFRAQVTDDFRHRSNAIANDFTLDTVAPAFQTLSPADGSVLQTAQAVLAGTIDDPQATVVLNGSGQTQTGPTFSFPVTLQPGANVFTLSAIDPAGNQTTAQRTLRLATLATTITSPLAGATISGSSALVTGTVAGPPNTGVTVNGVVAAIVGDRFYANVPLQAGANILTIITTNQDGSVVQQTVSVTGTGAGPIEVTATPESGVAPFKASFRVSAIAGTSIQRIEADLNGDGTVDSTTTDLSAPIEFTYAQAGVYAARFVFSESQGSTRTQILNVVVQDRAALDSRLRQHWTGLRMALVRGDKAQALQHLNLQARERYAPVFEALMPNMPSILESFTDLQTVEIDETVGEYAVNRIVGGVDQIFFFYFLRDNDGVWRLDSM